MSKEKREKCISELVLARNLVKERISDYRKQQEQYRKVIKFHEERLTFLAQRHLEKDTFIESFLRRMRQNIYENKIILNALQKQSLEIRKKIVKLNKEQVIKNNKENGK